MGYGSPRIVSDRYNLAGLPAWVTARAGESAQNFALLPGASFALLGMIQKQNGECVPKF